MPATTKRWNEENTVEHPIIEWLVTPELGWRFENQVAVNERYRTDEVEVLLLPILRQKLKDLNSGVITDDQAARTARQRGMDLVDAQRTDLQVQRR
jgi:type I restriction enzyme R subunit